MFVIAIYDEKSEANESNKQDANNWHLCCQQHFIKYVFLPDN